MNESAFEAWMRCHQTRVNDALSCLFPVDITKKVLAKAMVYVALSKGKRIRALLVFAAGNVSRARVEVLDQVACAVELIHAYSLVHDDMPCMDDDGWRRGQPACHIAFDEATALLVGDALQSLAFEVLSIPLVELDPMRQLSLVHQLSKAIGQDGMALGQAMDLENADSPLSMSQLETIYRLKTGELIRAAILLGGQCGAALSPLQQSTLENFAKHAGLLFQVTDDILDQAQDAALSPSNEAKSNPSTIVSTVGLSAAQAIAEDLYRKAIASLASLGDNACMLKDLVRYMVYRTL